MGIGTPSSNSKTERMPASLVFRLFVWRGDIVPLPAANRGGIAGAECPDQERDEQPIEGVRNRLACCVCGLAFGGYRFGDASFCLSLG